RATATTESGPLSLHDALPISVRPERAVRGAGAVPAAGVAPDAAARLLLGGGDRVRTQLRQPPQHDPAVARLPVRGRDHRPLDARSEEHTSELQSRENLVCRLL